MQQPVNNFPLALLHPGSVSPGDLVYCEQYSEALYKELVARSTSTEASLTGDPKYVDGIHYATFRAVAAHKKLAPDSASQEAQAVRNIVFRNVHAKHHAWLYFPEMTSDEVLVFKQYDTREDRMERRGVFHTAVKTPSRPDTPARRSCEVRVVCIFGERVGAEEWKERHWVPVQSAFEAGGACAPAGLSSHCSPGWFAENSCGMRRHVEAMLRIAEPQPGTVGNILLSLWNDAGSHNDLLEGLRQCLQHNPKVRRPTWLVERLVAGGIPRILSSVGPCQAVPGSGSVSLPELGMRVKDCIVDEVIRGKEAHLKNVNVGWTVHSVEGKQVRDDNELVKQLHGTYGDCEFVFTRPLAVGDRVRAREVGEVLEFFAKVDVQQEEMRQGICARWSLPAGGEATVCHLHPRPQCFVLKDPEGKRSYRIAGSVARKLQHTDGTPASPPVFDIPENRFRHEHREAHGICDVRSGTLTTASELRRVALRSPADGHIDPLSLMDERWPGHPDYANDCPPEHLVRLLCSHDAIEGVRSIDASRPQDMKALLGRLQRGEVLIKEVGLGAQGFLSMATKGFAPEPDMMAGGLALVSIPGGDQAKYNECAFICLEDGMAFCVVWERHYGVAWLLVWLRNVISAALAGATILVLTGAPNRDGVKVAGGLGFAQRVEVALLLCLSIPFLLVDIDDFIADRRPLHQHAKRGEWAALEGALDALCARGALDVLLRKTCALGKTPLHYVAEGRGPAQLIERLVAAKSDVMQRTAWGRSALHLCVETSRPRESGDGAEQAAALLSGNSALAALCDDGGFTALCAAQWFDNQAVAELLLHPSSGAPPLTEHELNHLCEKKPAKPKRAALGSCLGACLSWIQGRTP